MKHSQTIKSQQNLSEGHLALLPTALFTERMTKKMLFIFWRKSLPCAHPRQILHTLLPPINKF